jgi:hypothetical protein
LCPLKNKIESIAPNPTEQRPKNTKAARKWGGFFGGFLRRHYPDQVHRLDPQLMGKVSFHPLSKDQSQPDFFELPQTDFF